MQMRFSIKLCQFGSLGKLLLVCLLAFSVGTTAAAQEAKFYNNTRHGWFWYEDPPLVQEETEKTESKPSRQSVSLDNYTVQELWNMYPDDFQELLNKIQKKAVQSPTEQNIMEYLSMQDIARRKALAYTNATMYVTQKHAALFNANQVYPTTAPGITARVTMQSREIVNTINRAGFDHALIFFINPSCGFCKKQEQILAYFKDKYKWPIRTVDISRNINVATRFNITVTPTLLLIKKGQDDYLTISTGVIALTELERKLYRAIRFVSGNTNGDNFLMYDFQKGSPLDAKSILNKGAQPWANRNNGTN